MSNADADDRKVFTAVALHALLAHCDQRGMPPPPKEVAAAAVNYGAMVVAELKKFEEILK